MRSSGPTYSAFIRRTRRCTSTGVERHCRVFVIQHQILSSLGNCVRFCGNAAQLVSFRYLSGGINFTFPLSLQSTGGFHLLGISLLTSGFAHSRLPCFVLANLRTGTGSCCDLVECIPDVDGYNGRERQTLSGIHCFVFAESFLLCLISSCLGS